jgi:hypothetical protein
MKQGRPCPSLIPAHAPGGTSFETTRIDLPEAENLAAGFGTVFPPLPGRLASPTRPKHRPKVSASVSAYGLVRFKEVPENRLALVGATGFEPATP